jgi:hypothetical protein
MTYMCPMKKVFEERARLVVYLEQSDMVRMTEAARDSGVTLVEWARGVLKEESENGEPRGNHRAVVIERDKEVEARGRRKAAVDKGRGSEPTTATGKPIGVRLNAISEGSGRGIGKVSVDPTQDRCANPLCGHKRWEHKKNYCTHGDCRCEVFVEVAG